MPLLAIQHSISELVFCQGKNRLLHNQPGLRAVQWCRRQGKKKRGGNPLCCEPWYTTGRHAPLRVHFLPQKQECIQESPSLSKSKNRSLSQHVNILCRYATNKSTGACRCFVLLLLKYILFSQYIIQINHLVQVLLTESLQLRFFSAWTF